MAFNREGKLLLTRSASPSAHVWDTATGEMRARPQHRGTITAAVFSPDGKTVLTGSRDNTAQLWHAHQTTPFGPALNHQKAVRAVAFSPDGKLMLTGGEDSAALLWEFGTSEFRGRC